MLKCKASMDRSAVRPSTFLRLRLLVVFLGLFTLCGAGCPQVLQRYTNPLPRVLPPSPTLEQVIEVVNRNSSQIHSFSSGRASISGPGFPSLGTSIAFERPGRLRLRAGTGLTGTEFDVGSNDELFWFWLRRNDPPAMYYCRHDQFASSQAKQMLPFEPQWLVDAMGLAEFDPALPHQGPFPLPNDRLQIRTIRETPEGPVTKITIVDGSQGWILEQQIYDARRRLLASATASGHRRDPLSNLVMPGAVSINCPAAQFSMRIDLGSVEINRLSGDPAALWSMPNYPGAPLVNLADPNLQPRATLTSAPSSSQRPQQPANWRRPSR